MNKKKLLVVAVLAIFIVGLTMASVSAATYNIKCKNDGITVKKVGKYKIFVDTASWYSGRVSAVYITKGNKGYKPYVKYYYKDKGKNKVTKWMTRDKVAHPAYARWMINKKAKYRYVKVKIGKRIY